MKVAKFILGSIILLSLSACSGNPSLVFPNPEGEITQAPLKSGEYGELKMFSGGIHYQLMINEKKESLIIDFDVTEPLGVYVNTNDGTKNLIPDIKKINFIKINDKEIIKDKTVLESISQKITKYHTEGKIGYLVFPTIFKELIPVLTKAVKDF